MKIEKKKISGSRPLSAAAKSAIATALGMAAAFTLNACDDTVSGGSEEPLGGDVAPEEVIPPASSDSPETGSSEATPNSSSVTAGPASSNQVENTPSSSSEKIVDIPLSQEPVSSSVAEAISAMMESSSSEAAPASSEVAPTSSETAPTSSETATSSSSYAQWGPGSSSSSQNGWVQPNSSSVDYSEECPDNDPYCIHVHMSQDRPDGCMAASMVTTFERDDITG